MEFRLNKVKRLTQLESFLSMALLARSVVKFFTLLMITSRSLKRYQCVKLKVLPLKIRQQPVAVPE